MMTLITWLTPCLPNFSKFLHRSLTLPFLSLSRLCSLESNHFVQPWDQSGELCASQIISKCLRRVPSEQAALVFTFSDDTTHIEVRKQGQAVRSWRDGSLLCCPWCIWLLSQCGSPLKMLNKYLLNWIKQSPPLPKKKKSPMKGTVAQASLFFLIFLLIYSVVYFWLCWVFTAALELSLVVDRVGAVL